ncbi:MAG: hypothetical protein AAGB26_17700 [Planctomycetota bacterium]
MRYDFDIHERLVFQEDALIWRPSEPSKKFMGRIEFDADQGISTSFLSNPSIDVRLKIAAEGDPEEDEILFAETNKLGDVTLYDGFCRVDRAGWPGPALSQHHFNQALLGAHIENPDNEFFTSASIRLHNFEAFLATSPIKVNWRPPESISFHEPEKIEICSVEII